MQHKKGYQTKGPDVLKILVTPHAISQFAVRFPSEAPTQRSEVAAVADQIEAEVREAFARGRMSPSKPPCLYPPNDPTCLYVWTDEWARIYALRHDEKPPQFVVTTTMRPERLVAAA